MGKRAAARATLLVRAKKGVDRVPTKWYVTAATGVLLLATAAFGGLADAAVPSTPALKPGGTFSGKELDITVEKAVTIDGFPDSELIPKTGDRFLVVEATITDNGDQPISSANDGGVRGNLRVVGVHGLAGKPAQDVVVVSDGSTEPSFQPGVPLEVAFIWEAPAAALGSLDSVTADVLDNKTFLAEGALTYGARWTDAELAATLVLRVTDRGDGSGQ